MIAEGLSHDLLIAGIVILAFSFLVSTRVLSPIGAILVSLLKVAVPVAYFGWVDDGRWYLLDDETYLQNGLALQDAGLSPLTIFFSHGGRSALETVSGGSHFIYPWWNMIGLSLFGEHYYAPVFLNVALTFVGGWIICDMLRVLGFGVRYRQLFFVFFLFHWDVVVWSSFLNLKDILVMTITLFNFWMILRLVSKRSLKRLWVLSGFALGIMTFFWIRFYVPVVMLGALGIWVLLEMRSNVIYWTIVALVIGFFGAQFYSDQYLQYISVEGLAQRVARALLTPVPWQVGEDYSFLIVPSICHWALIVPAFFGALSLWRCSRFMRLLILYFVLIILFYGTMEDSVGGQDARYRVQVLFILALMQFQALWRLFKPVSAKGLQLVNRRPFTSPIPIAPVGIRRIRSLGS